MTRSGLLFVIYALCAYRLTVLVVFDSITAKLRLWCVRRKMKWLTTLVGCAWCVSIWISGGVVALARFGGSWAVYPCAALAFSGIVGFLSERE